MLACVHLPVSGVLLAILLGAAWVRSAPPVTVMRVDTRAEAVVRAAEAAERRACRAITAGRPSIVCEAR